MQTNRGTHFDPGKVDINLEKYIARSKKRLQAILKRLQWSQELLLQNYNKPSTAVTLLPDEVEPPLPSSFSTKNTVVIAEDALRAIVADPKAEIPQRFSDLQCNFSREQKLQIYEYVVQNTEKLLEPELTVPINDESHQSMTFAEIVAIKKREKNQKRRKYRTSKPTHIEEVRNLVELQMQALKQYLNPNEVTPPRLCHRERDLLKQQNKLKTSSTSKDKHQKSATKEGVSDKDNRERGKCSPYRRPSASRRRSPFILNNHKRRSSSHRHSTSKEKRDRKSLKQSCHKSSSRDRGHRSRSRDIRHRSRSKKRRHKSQSRSKERRRRSRSKERRHKSRSRSIKRRHRSRSKERTHRNQIKERMHKSRSRSRSKSRKRSRDRSDYRRRSRSGSHEKRGGQRKEHYHKRSDDEVYKSHVKKGGHKEYKSMTKNKHDECRTKKTQGHMDKSQGQFRDTCSDSYKSAITNTSEALNYDIKLEPVINNNGLPSYYIKLEVKNDPDSKTQVFEEIKMKTEPH